MRSKQFVVFAIFLSLLAFAIPIEHKYDKLFRFYSLTLVPQGIELSPVFDKKIYFYASDIIALGLLAAGLFWLRIPLRRFFVERGSVFLWIVFVCAFGSLLASPLAHYPVPYVRLLQLLTPILLFSFLAHAFTEEQKEKITRILLYALVAAALFQCALAITQYFRQDWLGLRILAEQKLWAGIGIPEGKRWIFDKFSGRTANSFVFRASGTMPHANVLGGFMALSILASYSLIASASSKWRAFLACTLPFQFFTLGITYSRSGIYACVLGSLIWFGLMIWRRRAASVRFVGIAAALSVAICGCLLFEQFTKRGGIVGQFLVAQPTDCVRVHYQNVAIKMIKKNPLLGVGFHQFSMHSNKYLPMSTEKCMYVSSTHNIYLLLGAETGLISLGAFLLFIGSILRAAIRSSITPMAASLIAIVIAFLMIGGCDFYPLLFQQGKLLLFIIAGLLAAHGNYERKAAALKTGSVL